jgi:hypothetical protein
MPIPLEHIVQVSRGVHRSLRDVQCLPVAPHLRVEKVAGATGYWAVGGGCYTELMIESESVKV